MVIELEVTECSVVDSVGHLGEEGLGRQVEVTWM